MKIQVHSSSEPPVEYNQNLTHLKNQDQNQNQELLNQFG